MTRSICGVIFDLDGTLYHLRVTRACLALRLWRTLPQLRHLGAARKAVRSSAHANEAALLDTFAAELASRTGTTADAAAAWYQKEFMARFLELLENRAICRPGLLPLLSRLRSAGIKLAVVSDIGLIEERLRAIGVPPEAFDTLLCAEQTGELKPSPRSLLAVAEQWGCSPQQMLMVGDRVDRDAKSAQKAGMDTIIIDNLPRIFGRRKKQGITLVPWKKAVVTISKRAGLE